MKESHGVRDAVKLRLTDDGKASVMISDGADLVHVHLDNATFGAGLTPTQARWIALQLLRSAARIEAAKKATKAAAK